MAFTCPPGSTCIGSGVFIAFDVTAKSRAIDWWNRRAVDPHPPIAATVSDEPPVEYIELNMSNYNEDDVSQLNEWAIWAAGRIEAIAESAAQPVSEPVAWMYDVASDGLNDVTQSRAVVSSWPDKSKIVSLFTHPTTVDGWVEVIDRPPEPDKWVIVYNGNWCGVGRHRPLDDYREESERWQDEHAEYIEHCGGKVTHWMPIPKPPLAGRTT